VVAFCGGALSGCGVSPPPTPVPVPAPTPKPPTPAPPTPAPPPTELATAWKNHFDAFGAGVGSVKDTADRKAALDKIMADYDDNSIVSIWYAAKSDAENCKGGETGVKCTPAVEKSSVADIRTMFDGLFEELQGCTEADIDDGLKPKWELTEPVGSAPGSVFLVWECKKTSFHKATDTFVFDGAKIRKQNIVVDKAAALDSHVLRQPASLSQGVRAQATPVADAWKNHFDAFGAGAAAKNDAETKAALDKIMEDYTEDSVVDIADYAEGATKIPDFKKHSGLTEIREMFQDLFTDIDDNCNLGAPLQEITGDGDSKAKQVFLVWRNLASTYKWATDTFVFDDNFKIIKQNIVAVHAAASREGCTDENSMVV